MIKFELTLNDFYVDTLNELVRQFNELIPDNATYSYSSQDVIELLIIREHVNSEMKLIRPWERSIFLNEVSLYVSSALLYGFNVHYYIQVTIIKCTQFNLLISWQYISIQ